MSKDFKSTSLIIALLPNLVKSQEIKFKSFNSVFENWIPSDKGLTFNKFCNAFAALSKDSNIKS